MFKFILILSLTSLLWWNQRPSNGKPAQSRHAWEIISNKDIENFVSSRLKKAHLPAQKQAILLWKAFLWGDTKSLSWKFRLAINELNLPHLFTPSGLHFWALRFATAPVEYLLYLIHPWFMGLFQVSMYSIPFFLQGMLAFKRMAFFHLVLLGLKFLMDKRKLKLKKYIFWIFLAVFFLDFIFGTYSQAPLSYILSFLFLGSILACAKPTFLKTWAYISSAQIFFALIITRPFTSMALLVSPLLVGQFGVLFPLILLSLIFPNLWLVNKILWGTQLFMREIHFFYSFSLKYPKLFLFIEPSFFLVIGLPLLFSSKFNVKKFGLVLILLNPSWALNHPRKDWSVITKQNLFPQSTNESRYSRIISRKFPVMPKNCQLIPLEGNYFLKCRDNRAKQSR